MRRFLDTLYRTSLWLAALCLAAIALMVALQLLGRIADGVLRLVGVGAYGFVILSLAEIAGYLLATASFLALAATLKAGGHIRVTILLGGLEERHRRWLEVAVLIVSAAVSGFITWNIGAFAYASWRFNEVSIGMVQVPLALPQAAMALGALVLTISLLDELVVVLRTGRPTFRATEDAITLGKDA